MKKVLILAYDFPPFVSVGGLRPHSWLKYFHEFDIYPVIITRQWNNKFGNDLDYIAPGISDSDIIEVSDTGTVIMAPFKPNLSNRLLIKYGDHRFRFFRKLISAYYEFAQFLCLQGPKVSIYRSASGYLSKNKVDYIIATGDPFVLFKYAGILGKKYNVPWIADYRDQWSEGKYIGGARFKKNWDRIWEKRIVKRAAFYITVSEFLNKKIGEVLPTVKGAVITNGFDPEAISDASLIEQRSDIFRIAYVGTIYDYNPIKTFLRSFSEYLHSTNANVQLNLYGVKMAGISFGSDLETIIAEEFPELKDYVVFHAKRPNAELMKELARNNIMLLFNYYSYMGTKIFDYAALKRLILLCYSNDNEAKVLKERYYDIDEDPENQRMLQEEFIKETQAGIIVEDSTHLSKVLSYLYEEFIKSGRVHSNVSGLEKYSRKEQVRKLASLIKHDLGYK